MNNLLQNIPQDLPEEFLETLVESGNLHIKRIVSRGHSSPGEGWYDQQTNEFVLVRKGAARLEFESGRVADMGPGDWLQIPARARHRVAWTHREQDTVWLAVHY